MSCILYSKENGEIVEHRVRAIEVSKLLKSGYKATKEEFVDTNKSGKLSTSEIKAAAKEAGITIGRKSIKTLKAELGLDG